MTKDILTQDELKAQLHYNPETGVFTRLKANCTRVKVGDIAGNLSKSTGYIRFSINKKEYVAHRLAWLYMTGSFPINEIDHINGIKHDNRFSNLRDVPHEVNQRNAVSHRGFGNKNNVHGYAGVCFEKKANRYRAECNMFGIRKVIGYYLTAKQAGAAYFLYVRKMKQLHKELIVS
jgi:hypothetical protein